MSRLERTQRREEKNRMLRLTTTDKPTYVKEIYVDIIEGIQELRNLLLDSSVDLDWKLVVTLDGIDGELYEVDRVSYGGTNNNFVCLIATSKTYRETGNAKRRIYHFEDREGNVIEPDPAHMSNHR